MHAAARTSVGQCTPSTSRETGTRDIHRIAIDSASLRAAGLIRLAQRAAAVANAATTRVCPLGKLEPQYASVSQSAGRALPTSVLTTWTTAAAPITEAARSSASRRRRANSSAIVAALASGNRTLDDPVSVTASKNPVSAPGTCPWMNSRIAWSIGPDSPPMASSLTLIADTARTSTDRMVKRRLSSGPDQAGRVRRTSSIIRKSRLACGGQGRVLSRHPEYETSVCDKGYARNADECQYPLQRARHELGVDLTRSFVGFPHLGEECRAIAQGFDVGGRLYLGQRLLGRFSGLELECQGSAGEIFRDVPKYYRQ